MAPEKAPTHKKLILTLSKIPKRFLQNLTHTTLDPIFAHLLPKPPRRTRDAVRELSARHEQAAAIAQEAGYGLTGMLSATLPGDTNGFAGPCWEAVARNLAFPRSRGHLSDNANADESIHE